MILGGLCRALRSVLYVHPHSLALQQLDGRSVMPKTLSPPLVAQSDDKIKTSKLKVCKIKSLVVSHYVIV